jgi:hypothetical protein
MRRKKYLAFDIETAKILPDDFGGDLHAHRPLGITCAATLPEDGGPERVFYSHADGNPAPRMSREDLSAFVDSLLASVADGYTIVTLNGLGFDFDILAEESGRLDDCRRLALGHVDMMFHIFCSKGFAVGLNAAAKAIGLSKTADVDGSLAPMLWRDGEHRKVLDYVVQDCRITLDVAAASERQGMFRWMTKRGSLANMTIPGGWLAVHEAMTLPLPDTSWMDNPWPRSKFTDWLY